MKKLKCFLASLGAICLISGSACFSQETMIESYAHPTMFGTAGQETISADAVYAVGGKILKTENRLSVKGKSNVLISSWAKDVLTTIKENTNEKLWNPKMPILRSELAVVLAEGLFIKESTEANYTDISKDYWAKQWIDRATSAKVMIGYPSQTFRPDQPVTKAEVFATIATLIDVPTDKSLIVPTLDGNQIQYIPTWAIGATKEIVNSELLDEIPNTTEVAENEYLSKEQVAYLVGNLRQNFIFNKKNNSAITKYTPTILKVEFDERVSSRTSNVGDIFTAKTTDDVVIANKCFDEGSIVIGKVMEIQRPGYKKPGFVKVKFTKIISGDCSLEFPKNISEAQACDTENPNVFARILGAPFSAAGRVLGVSGRTIGSIVDVTANGVEAIGGNLSDTFVNTLSLEPKSGLVSFGRAFVYLGKGIYDIAKVAVSGVFGVVYEFGDEVVYIFAPNLSNDSSLNPDEELIIVY